MNDLDYGLCCEANTALQEYAAYRMLLKFHDETDCGADGNHWHECNLIADAFGWTSWDAWRASGQKTAEAAQDFIRRLGDNIAIEQEWTA